MYHTIEIELKLQCRLSTKCTIQLKQNMLEVIAMSLIYKLLEMVLGLFVLFGKQSAIYVTCSAIHSRSI